MTKRQKLIKLAIFDIDGTIFRSSLLIESFDTMIENGIFPQRAKREVEKEYLAWLNRKGHYNDYLMKLIQVYYKYFQDCSVKDVRRVTAEVIDWQKDRVYRYTRDLAKRLKKDGYCLVAISGSQNVLVEAFAKKFGFDAWFGRELEIKKGFFTGRILSDGKKVAPDARHDKPKILHSFVEKTKIKVDWRNSIAVGDSEGDIAMLSMVGKPIAFNPSGKLAAHAKKHGWKIVVERKDVVYQVNDCTFVAVNDPKPIRKYR